MKISFFFCLSNYQTKPSDKISSLNTYFHWGGRSFVLTESFSPNSQWIQVINLLMQESVISPGHSPRTIPGQ